MPIYTLAGLRMLTIVNQPKIRLCNHTLEWNTMILRCLNVFNGGLRQNLYHWHVYSGVLPCVNRGETGKTQVNTPESCHAVCLIPLE